jgi:hypothetical protein
MNLSSMGMLAAAAAISAVAVDAPEQIKQVYLDTLAAVQQVCTAGDMKSISTMLSAKVVMDRHLVSEAEFDGWLLETFKETNVKELAVDHWGQVYRYTVAGRQFELRSAGPDGVFDNDDDLKVHGP